MLLENDALKEQNHLLKMSIESAINHLKIYDETQDAAYARMILKETLKIVEF